MSAGLYHQHEVLSVANTTHYRPHQYLAKYRAKRMARVVLAYPPLRLARRAGCVVLHACRRGQPAGAAKRLSKPSGEVAL